MRNHSFFSNISTTPLLSLFAVLLMSMTATLQAAAPDAKSEPKPKSEASAPDKSAPFTPAEDMAGSWDFTADPDLPNVLIIGDSISIGYTRQARQKLAGKANVYRPMRGKGPDNCGDTTIGLNKIDAWLGERKWDVIHFNWGLWDLCYRNPDSKVQGNRDKVGGKISTTPEDYEKNLEKLVVRMKATGARLIWANTTVVPDGEVGRFVGDDEKYNLIAARVMRKHGVPTNDLFTLTKGFSGVHSTKAGDVHYTESGYGQIAVQVAAQIESSLTKKPEP